MTDPTQTLRDDIAFLRELTTDSGRGLARDGVIMVTVGVIFGAVTLVYWLIFAGYAPGLQPVAYWLWAAGLALFFLIAGVINRRLPAPAGGASRAMAAAWSGIGISLVPANVGLIIAGMRIGDMSIVYWVFPILLFTLYGAAWAVAFAVKRQAWFAWTACGCFLAALAEGALYGTPHQWLALSIGLVLCLAIPGMAILRQARAAA